MIVNFSKKTKKYIFQLAKLMASNEEFISAFYPYDRPLIDEYKIRDVKDLQYALAIELPAPSVPKANEIEAHVIRIASYLFADLDNAEAEYGMKRNEFTGGYKNVEKMVVRGTVLGLSAVHKNRISKKAGKIASILKKSYAGEIEDLAYIKGIDIYVSTFS